MIQKIIFPSFEPKTEMTGDPKEIYIDDEDKKIPLVIISTELRLLKNDPQTLLVLFNLAPGKTKSATKVIFGAVQCEAAQMKGRGKYSVEPEEGGMGKPEISSTFDTAAYKMTETETALGFQVRNNTIGGRSDGSEVTRYLFRLADKNLVFVLQGLASSSENDHSVENAGSEEKCVIQILGSKTKGVFDWQNRCKASAKEASEKKSKFVSKFVWDGSKYLEAYSN